MSGFSRRGFLTGAAVSTSALALAGCNNQGSSPDAQAQDRPALADALLITMSNPTDQPREKGSGSSGGYGIVGMRERASVVGGSLQVQDGEESFSWTLRLPRKEEK